MFRQYIPWMLFACSIGVKGRLANDTLGWEDGYTTLSTANFDAMIVKDSQTLASLKVTGSTFDFLPFDLIEWRSDNGMYHIGDITYRFRVNGTTGAWTSGDSSVARQAVAEIPTGGLAAANLKATLPASSLNVTREWIEVDGDLGLMFTVMNTGKKALEIGSLGFPLE